MNQAAQQTGPLNLNISRVFKCDAKTLFTAISEGKLFESCDYDAPNSNFSFDKGGAIHLEWKSDGDKPIVVEGQFTNIDPHHTIEFSWDFNSSELGRKVETLVTVSIEESGGKSTMSIFHRGFETAAQFDDHYEGWTDAFKGLKKIMRELKAKLDGIEKGHIPLDLSFTLATNVDAPLEKVFQAVQSKELVETYFDCKMSQDFTEGQSSGWDFGKHGKFELKVHQLIENQLIKFEWGHGVHVCFSFCSLSDGKTRVTIDATGWQNTQEHLQDSYDECEGWRDFLARLRQFMEA